MPRSTSSNDAPNPTAPDKSGWRYFGDGFAGRLFAARLQAYNATTLAYQDVVVDDATGGVVTTSSGGGGGGGAVTVADGADVAQGSTADASSASTVVGLLKAIKAAITGTVAVSGTFWQATQPVSIASMPATPVTDNGGSLTVDDGGGSLTVDGSVSVSNFPASQAVTGPLTDTQLRATPVPVSGTVTANATLAAETTKVIGTVNVAAGQSITANAGTNLNTSALALDATLTGGTQKTKVVDSAGTNALAVNGSGQIGISNFPASQAVTGTFWQATQPVSGTVTANAGTGPFPVSDNGGSITVDAPVGTPAFVRLSDGSAAIATLPVSMATQTPDTVDRAAREVGRVRLWDGTDEATITPLRTVPGTEKTLNVREIPNRLATYSSTIATQTPAITVGVKELLALWHANTGTKDIYIVEIWVTGLVTTASTAGRSAIRVSTITTAPTGGTATGFPDLGGSGAASDMTNSMQVKTGGGTIGTTFIRKLVWQPTQAVGSRISETIFQASNPGNGIVLPQGSSLGISIDLEREVAHTALVDVWTVGARWLEI